MNILTMSDTISDGQSFERRAWTKNEDECIIFMVQKYGTKRWSIIADNLNKENLGTERTGKQCRTRCVFRFVM